MATLIKNSMMDFFLALVHLKSTETGRAIYESFSLKDINTLYFYQSECDIGCVDRGYQDSYIVCNCWYCIAPYHDRQIISYLSITESN